MTLSHEDRKREREARPTPVSHVPLSLSMCRLSSAVASSALLFLLSPLVPAHGPRLFALLPMYI